MSTTVEIDRGSGFVELDYSDYVIELGTSATQVAPSATVSTRPGEAVAANDDVRITIDSTVRFDGVAADGGQTRLNGRKKVALDHPAVALFEERVDVSLTETVTAQDVLSTALSNAERGGDFTLDYVGSDTTLNSDYEVTDRKLTQVFRDMTDRTSRVWRVDPAGTTIHVEPKGDRGTWQSFDTEVDGTPIVQFNPGTADSVQNAVTVTATGGEAVSATATDSTSISTYGRRAEAVNIQYATTQSEAQSYADELIIAEPLAEGVVRVPETAGTIAASQINKTLDIVDDSKDVDETGLLIQAQTIQEGRAEIKVGEGTGISLERINRSSKSTADKSAAGTVFNSDNLATGSVDSDQLVDSAVIEQKLADLAVTLNKVDTDAIDETKVTDDAITTPKIAADAVTANEIDAGTITAVEIASRTIAALNIKTDELTANEIAADTITANEIDVLNLSAGELTVTDDPSNPSTGLEIDIDAQGRIDLRPLSGTVADIGFDREINSISANRMRPSEELAVGVPPMGSQTGGIASFEPDDGDTAILLAPPNDITSFYPLDDNSARLGRPSFAFADVYAHNYVTASPDAIDGVARDTIATTDWYDNPPAVVREAARTLGPTDEAIPEGRDHIPVELATMTNWLLEACKTQQAVIDDQRDRLESLEDRIADLEATK